MQLSPNPGIPSPSWPTSCVSKFERYLMAQRPILTPPESEAEAEAEQPVSSIAEAFANASFDRDIYHRSDLQASSIMSGAGSSSNAPHGFHGSSSSKYSHEDTRPEKIQENLKNLDDTMHKTLRRLDHLEAKLKTSTGKKGKKTDPSSARRNEELGKALDRIMDRANDEKSN